MTADMQDYEIVLIRKESATVKIAASSLASAIAEAEDTIQEDDIPTYEWDYIDSSLEVDAHSSRMLNDRHVTVETDPDAPYSH